MSLKMVRFGSKAKAIYPTHFKIYKYINIQTEKKIKITSTRTVRIQNTHTRA